MNIPVLIVDLDGTVRRSRKEALVWVGGDAGPPMTVDDVELFPGAEETIHKYVQETDCVVVGVTNQGHVAKGKLTVAESNAIQDATRHAFKVDPFHMILASYAYHNPAGEPGPWNRRSLLRKPAYGMLAAIELSAEEHGIALDWDHPATVMVGDWTTDSGCARAAGIRFQWAWEFFNRPMPGRNGPALERLDLVHARIGWMINEAMPVALRSMGADAQACVFETISLDCPEAIQSAHAVISSLLDAMAPATLAFAGMTPVPRSMASIVACVEFLNAVKSKLFWLNDIANASMSLPMALNSTKHMVATTAKDLMMPPPAGLT